jgi:hypothetical protein
MSFPKHPTSEPTAVQIMADAFDEAWAVLGESGDARRHNPQELKLALAKRIIELASSSGDYDAQTLRDIAIASLTEPRLSPVQH